MNSSPSARPVPTRRPPAGPATTQAGRPLLRRALIVCAALVLCHSLWFAWRYFEPIPWLDMWDWIDELRRQPAGGYGFQALLTPHNEHRIVTAKLFFLADAAWFHMTFRAVAIANLVLLGLLAAVLHRLWRAAPLRGTQADLPLLFFVAFITSTCQWGNLVSPFQIQFALLCLSATLSVACLAWATVPQSGAAPFLQAVAAAVFYLLAAYSMGGGILLGVPLLLVLVLRRPRPAVLAAFLVPAGAVAAVFLTHFQRPTVLDAVFAPSVTRAQIALGMAGFSLGFAGSALRAYGRWVAVPFGLAALAALAVMGLRAIRARLDGAILPARAAAFLALGAFVAANAFAASRLRFFFGVWGALQSRYSVLSLILILALAGAAIRRAAASGGRAAALVTASPLVPVGAIAALLAVNIATDPDHMAKTIHSKLDIAATTLRAGVDAPPLLAILYPSFDTIAPAIAFTKAHGLGAFAGSNTPPRSVRTALARMDAAHLPPCAGVLNTIYRLDASRAVLRAWVAAPDRSRTAGWVAVLDGTHRIAAVLPAQEPRDDMPLAGGATGSMGVFGAIAGSLPDDALTLVGVFDGAALCRLDVPGPGPIRFQNLPAPMQAAPAPAPPALSGGFAPQAQAPWPGAKSWASPAGGSPAAEAAFTIPAPADPADGVILPFSAHHNPGGQAIAVTFADGTRVGLPIPAELQDEKWHAAALPAAWLARHHGPLTLTVRVSGGPETGIAIAQPAALRLDPEAGRLPD